MNLKPSRTHTNTSNHSNKKQIPGFSNDLPGVGPERKRILTAFVKTVRIRIKNLELLNLSFMHRSVSNESGQRINNERLEFLGDAVLGLIAAALLYDRFREKPEGELAKIKAVVVSEDILSAVALQFQIDTLLILGKGEENSGGRTKKTILADALEALIGAIYLDSGFEAAFSFVSGFLENEINRVLEERHHRDYKSLLQELSQRHYKTYPFYRMIKRTGPEHSRIFTVEVTVNDRNYGPGSGRSKKSAEQEAARMAYDALNLL